MKINRSVGWGLAGAAAGAILVLVLLAILALPVPRLVLEKLPTRTAAKVLLGRVGESVVADSRSYSPMAYGVAFFDRPEPAGEFLCGVKVYSVPAEIVDRRTPDRSIDGFESSVVYGLWRDPSDAQSGSRRGNEGCRTYRDFEHLLGEGDPGAADAGLRFLASSRDAARQGTAIPVTCRSRREVRSGAPCDGIALLRGIDLKKVEYAETIADHISDDGVPWRATYRLTLDDGQVHGHPAMTVISISGRHLPGMRVHSIDAVLIERDVA